MLAMRRGCSGCGSCLLWGIIAVLLVDGWVGSSWALRAVELGTAAAVVVVAAIYQQRHRPMNRGEALPALRSAPSVTESPSSRSAGLTTSRGTLNS